MTAGGENQQSDLRVTNLITTLIWFYDIQLKCVLILSKQVVNVKSLLSLGDLNNLSLLGLSRARFLTQ